MDMHAVFSFSLVKISRQIEGMAILSIIKMKKK